jgi:hypothetical protein
MTEDALLGGGPLEPTNEWYALAKIAGLKLCAAYRRQYGCDFIAAQPTNLYGPGDTYDLAASHVVPALIVTIHAAKMRGAARVPVWGTGQPRREFLHVDDLADALVFLMQRYSDENMSTSAVAKTSASRSWPGQLPISRTALRENCSTSRCLPGWAGKPASACVTASRTHTPRIWPNIRRPGSPPKPR